MKNSIVAGFLLFTGLLITSSYSVHPPLTRSADELTAAERKYAVDYYLQTKERLLKDLKGLSDAQLHFKADPTRWSIAECTEHIALAESFILSAVQMSMQGAATPEKRADVKVTAEQLIVMVTDRSHKAQAPEPLKPSGRFATTWDAEKAFISRRDSTIDYIKTTHDDLKDHFITNSPIGTIDAYEGLIFLAAHSARHTLQIEEVMADPNFPKK